MSDGHPELGTPGCFHVWLHRGDRRGQEGSRADKAAMRDLLVALVRRYLRRDDFRIDRTCIGCGRQHGKPVVMVGDRRSPLRVSVAHAGAVTVFAFSSGSDIGVDIEVVRPGFDWMPLLADVFSATERRQAEQAAGDADARRLHYYERWVAKEAALKATGVGLAGTLREVDTTGWPLARWNGWHMSPLPVGPPLVGAVAGAEPVRRVSLLEVPLLGPGR